MFFNSIDFTIFLPIVFILYWFVTSKNLKLQNFLIVIASYTFYGWWDWRFLSLIIFSTLVDYTIGIQLSKTNKVTKRKILLWISVLVNLGFLGFFKYYNFFLDNFIQVFTILGMPIKANSLNIILPVGISFYTFQTMSYTIDVYRKKLDPTKDLIAFSAFVSFFPQLVAGPIERATNLLPQFYKKRQFNYIHAADGLRQILWGLFKKMVIADNSAEYVNMIFDNSHEQSGSTLLLGAFFFAFQIYGDFSGYSDIAIGTSRLFGFKLKQNFAFPYFSRNIAEFWRRWHISLSTWFRDYLYIPLGGSRGSIWNKVRNVFIIFIVSGFWHGANWTFIIWGSLNALYFLPLLLSNNNREYLDIVAKGRLFPTILEFLLIVKTFVLTLFAWIFFRADNLGQAIEYVLGIFSKTLFSIPHILQDDLIQPISSKFVVLLFLFLFMEWIGREQMYALEKIALNWQRFFRYTFYALIILAIFWFTGEEQQFIYFQF